MGELRLTLRMEEEVELQRQTVESKFKLKIRDAVKNVLADFFR